MVYSATPLRLALRIPNSNAKSWQLKIEQMITYNLLFYGLLLTFCKFSCILDSLLYSLPYLPRSAPQDPPLSLDFLNLHNPREFCIFLIIEFMNLRQEGITRYGSR